MSVLSIIPVRSEKAYVSATANTYVFRVPLTANKQQIADAVTTQYGVTVTKVTSLVQNGKAIAYSKGKRGRPGITHRKDTKKAYVVLAEGDSIKVFDEAQAEEKK